LALKRDAVLDIVRRKGVERRDEPFRLSSGAWSYEYVDAKLALASGSDLRMASEAIVEVAAGRGADFDTVGGLTMGADALAHGVALVSGARWFAVRKEQKDHGMGRRVEGSPVAGALVLLLDDVVTTGGSILEALDVVEAEGGRVQLATCLVDRSGRAGPRLAERRVAFEPLMTWKDLGLQPLDVPPA
jgi:orotate phosphoribosyltransferase